jgi:hypothetical protein
MSYMGDLTDRFCAELDKLLEQAYETGVNGQDVVYELRRQAAKIANDGIEFGMSGATQARISEMLGMSKDEMARAAIDLDICDCARRLIDSGVDLNDRAAVEQALGEMINPSLPRFVDAVLIAAQPDSISEQHEAAFAQHGAAVVCAAHEEIGPPKHPIEPPF